jgi:spore germination protein GerM
MTVRRLLRVTPVALVLVALAGCGVRAQSQAIPFGRDDVPFGLAARSTTTTLPPTPTTAAEANRYTLFFVTGLTLVTVDRGASTAASPTAIMRALVRGPSDAEAASGLRSLIPSGVSVLGVSVRGGVATLQLQGEFVDDADATARGLALAQLVYTATAIPGIDKVRLQLGGKVVALPRGDGELTRGAVGRDDYPEPVQAP